MFMQNAGVGVNVSYSSDTQHGNDDPGDETAGEGSRKDEPEQKKRDNHPIDVGTMDDDVIFRIHFEEAVGEVGGALSSFPHCACFVAPTTRPKGTLFPVEQEEGHWRHGAVVVATVFFL